MRPTRIPTYPHSIWGYGRNRPGSLLTTVGGDRRSVLDLKPSPGLAVRRIPVPAVPRGVPRAAAVSAPGDPKAWAVSRVVACQAAAGTSLRLGDEDADEDTIKHSVVTTRNDPRRTQQTPLSTSIARRCNHRSCSVYPSRNSVTPYCPCYLHIGGPPSRASLGRGNTPYWEVISTLYPDRSNLFLSSLCSMLAPTPSASAQRATSPSVSLCLASLFATSRSGPHCVCPL